MSSKFSVDFTNVEDSKEIKPGKYLAKVVSIEKKTGQSGYDYLQWKLQIKTAPAKGLHINHITSLKPSALFNLRDTLVACGFNVPKSAITIDPAKLPGRTLGIDVYMRPSQDGSREWATVKKTFPESEFHTSSDGGLDENDLPF